MIKSTEISGLHITSEQLNQLTNQLPYLKMLILFGSRARGDTHKQSDWDFAVLYDKEMRKESLKETSFGWWEVPGILGKIFLLNSNEIDLVDLNSCSNLIAHFIARDGKVIYEKEDGNFEKFKEEYLQTQTQIQVNRQALRNKIERNLQKWGV